MMIRLPRRLAAAILVCAAGWVTVPNSGVQALVGPQQLPAFKTIIQPSTTLLAATKTTATTEQAVQSLLQLSRSLGPVGVRRSESEQQQLLDAALALSNTSKNKPARMPLTGRHDLVYSAAPGGSSGKIGFLDGQVAQDFIDDTRFINSVQLGPLTIALHATRQIKNDTTIQVKFETTKIYLFGQLVKEQETKGGGVWNYLYAGTITDEKDGQKKFVRIMQTPSLFVIEQPVAAP